MTLGGTLLVALGGALGAVARYGVGVLALSLAGPGLPVGTWAVNAVGCALVGVALAVPPAESVRLAAVIGFLGAFTTFSAYSADTLTLWAAGRPAMAALNALGSVAVGLVCTGAGVAVGRALAA